MATDLPIDDLINQENCKAGIRRDSDGALEASVRPPSQSSIIKLFGTIDFEPDYDYKDQRSHVGLDYRDRRSD